jgi:hypothetical protein
MSNEQPIVVHPRTVVDNEEDEVSCTICFVCLTDSSQMVYTCSTPQCKSLYCVECLCRWMATKPKTCALCKHSDTFIQQIIPSRGRMGTTQQHVLWITNDLNTNQQAVSGTITMCLWLCVWCACVVHVYMFITVIFRVQAVLAELEAKTASPLNIQCIVILYRALWSMYLGLICMYGTGLVLTLRCLGAVSTRVYSKVLCIHGTCNILTSLMSLFIIFFTQYTGEKESMTQSEILIIVSLVSLLLDIHVIGLRLSIGPT